MNWGAGEESESRKGAHVESRKADNLVIIFFVLYTIAMDITWSYTKVRSLLLSLPPPSLSLSLCPKLYSKPVHNTSLTETRHSDSNPEVRELIAMGWPLCIGIHNNLHIATRITFKNESINSRAFHGY